VQRILVPLDASEHSLAALETAAELAAAENAELEGLFVEDTTLLQLSEYPFAQEISILSPVLQQVERSSLERQLRIRAQRLQTFLSHVADRFNIRWKFRVTRGGVHAEVLAAAENADLTILGKTGWSRGVSNKVGSTVSRMIANGRGLTLIVQHGMRFESPVQVVFTGSELSEKALDIAASLCKAKGFALVVHILESEPSKKKQQKTQVQEILTSISLQASFCFLVGSEAQQIIYNARLYGQGPLFIPCGEHCLHGQGLQTLVSLLSNPIFLVRKVQ
jgi:nucleotide-binding universal stress UspA family protein